MAKRKGRDFDQDDEHYERQIESVQHHFVVKADEAAKPVPKVELPQHEIERRELQRRYKKLFGFKPTERDLETLRRLVETAETRYG